MTKIFSTFLIGCLLCSNVFAEETPNAPFLASLPKETSWRMDFTTSASGNSSPSTQPAPAAKKQFVVIRTRNLCREVTTWSDGTTTDVWRAKGSAFIRMPKTDHFTAYMPQDNPYGETLPDFAGLEWVNLNHFKGVQTKSGQSCFVYSIDQAKAPFPYKSPYLGSDEMKLGSVTLWVSTQTKLPVAWQDSTSTALYSFNLPPAGLTLPAECQGVVDSIDAYEKTVAGKKMMLPP